MPNLKNKIEKQGGKLVGYARVSTTDQNTDIQLDQLNEFGCDKVFSERISGSSRKRPELDRCLEYVREGDMLVITRIDRLGRSQRDLLDILDELKELKVELYIIQQNIDTSTPTGKMFFSMVAMFAEFELNIKKERQAEGIAKAKAKGKYLGRKPVSEMTVKNVWELKAKGFGPAKIARELGIGRTSVYKYLALDNPLDIRDKDTDDMFDATQ